MLIVLLLAPLVATKEDNKQSMSLCAIDTCPSNVIFWSRAFRSYLTGVYH
jgi:hypothetical protein